MFKVRNIISVLLLALVISCTTTKTNEDPNVNRKEASKINVRLGMAYLQNKEMQRAQQKLLLALDEDPTLPEAWYSMGYLLENTGEKDEALSYYLKAVQLAPMDGAVQNNYGTYLCRNGQYQKAINHFLLATQDRKYLESAGAYENAGICALKIPNKQLAKTYFKLALDHDNSRFVAANELKKLEA